MGEYKKVVILADYGSIELAKKIHSKLSKHNIPGDIHDFNPFDLYISRFKNGEIDLAIERNVRGRDVFVIKSCNIYNKPVKKGDVPKNLEYDPNNAYMELFLINDALKNAGASSIINVMPHKPYERQDRRPKRKGKKGEGRKLVRGPISAKLFANFTAISGAKEVLTLDPHFKQIEGFYNIVHDCLESNVLFAEYIENNFGDRLDELVLIAPDFGSNEKTDDLAEIFGIPTVQCPKRRINPDVCEMGTLITDINFAGKICLSLDDMIDGGSTTMKAKEALDQRGAKEVIALCTHPILSEDAKEKLLNAGLKLVTTNSIAIPNLEKYQNIEVLDISRLIAEAIYCICSGKSLSRSLFDYKQYKKKK